jgi:hypothetical protein
MPDRIRRQGLFPPRRVTSRRTACSPHLSHRSCRRSGPRSAGTTSSPPAARTRTASPGPRPAGPVPATGARSARTTPAPGPAAARAEHYGCGHLGTRH